MKREGLCVALFALLLTSTVLPSIILTNHSVEQVSPDVYVGVDMAYCATTGPSDARPLIDQVSGFTNLFVSGTTAITSNSTTLNSVLQYAYDRGMSFISFLPDTFGDVTNSSDPTFVPEAAQWLETAQASWGDRLLGFLQPVKDEPGGKVLDSWKWGAISLTTQEGYYAFVDGHSLWVSNLDRDDYVTNYTDATSKYETLLNSTLHTSVLDAINSTKEYPLFTSDYALYWFDYKGGYDAVFAEFGWNYSRPLNVALCRGAAQMQGKDWGVIITWTYDKAPYLESGNQLYTDMKYAYDSGAKYIIVFNSNQNYNQSILQPEHLAAMQKFWEYAKATPRNSSPVGERTAYVLPYGYAYGFRGPTDSVWGLWQSINETDNSAQTAIVNSLLEKYGDKLDIVYDDNLQPQDSGNYNSVLYWNDSTLLPSPMPTPWPTITPSPTRFPFDSSLPTDISIPLWPWSPQPSPSLSTAPSSSVSEFQVMVVLPLVAATAVVSWFASRRGKTK